MEQRYITSKTSGKAPCASTCTTPLSFSGGAWDALLVLFTAPAGFLAGIIVATIGAYIVERGDRSPDGTSKRHNAAFLGAISPIVAVLGLWAIALAISALISVF